MTKNQKGVAISIVFLLASFSFIVWGVIRVNNANDSLLTSPSDSLLEPPEDFKELFKPPVEDGNKPLPFREGSPKLFMNEKQHEKEIAILEKENPSFAYVANQIQDFDIESLWKKANKIYFADPETWKRFPAELVGHNIFYYEKYDRGIPPRKYEVKVKVPVKTVTHKVETFWVYTWNERLARDEAMKNFEWDGDVVDIKEIKE